MTAMVCPIVNAPAGRLLGVYDIVVATPRAVPLMIRLAGMLGSRVGDDMTYPVYLIGYGVLGFLRVGITIDIFQNIHILYLQYGVLVFTGYGVLNLFSLWSLMTTLRTKVIRELHELHAILAFVDSRLESIKQFLNNFTNQPNETNMTDLESDDESVDTPFVSPFHHSDNDSDDDEVLNELSEYENAGLLRRERIINSFDGDDLAFQCMIGFRKFTAYLDPFLPMNIISRKALMGVLQALNL
ncbi:hypothetical protein Tco_0812651 [Tanacetum coccineum]